VKLTVNKEAISKLAFITGVISFVFYVKMEQIPKKFPALIMAHKLGGRYEILRTLATGGFGQTYLAVDTHLPTHPQCVIKQLKPQSNDPAVIAIAQRLFNTEAETLDKLGSHHQIPELFAHFEENQEFYLAQAYIEGHAIGKEIVNGKPLLESQVRDLVKDVLEVLAFVHQNNVIHRDIKPDNIMRRDRDGKIILIDFGIAKHISSQMMQQGYLPKLTVPIGTPGYTPPEQEKGNPTLASDVYALGMIAIEALTGIAPDQLPKDQNGEIVWKNQAVVSPEFAKMIDKMVRYQVSDRYQNAQEIFKELVATIVLPQPTQPTQISQAPSKSPPRFIVLVGSSLLIAIVASFLIAFILTPRTPQVSPPAHRNQPRGPL